MQVYFKIWVNDRPGILDSIAGMIRRKGWNINNISCGDAVGGLSQMNLTLQAHNVDLSVLEEHLNALDGVYRWETCKPETHCIRELAMFCLPEHVPMPDLPGIHVIDCRNGFVFAEYSASPEQVDQLVAQLDGAALTRTGPLTLMCP